MKQVTLPAKPKQGTALAQTEAAPLVRAEVIAKALDVHKRTICLWAQNGTIPCRRIGGALRFNFAEVMEVVK